MEKIEKLKTEISNIYGERLSFDHWEELEYSVIDEIGLKVNEIIDRLNEQPEEECEHEIPTCLGIAIGDIGLSLYGEPPEKGYRCAKCGEYISERDKDATIEYLYKVIKEKEQELDKAREEGYKEGFDDGLQDVKKIEREK
jgi:transcription initiation factor IIE alpha subunit